MDMYRKSAGPQFRGARFVWKFTRKNAHGMSEEPFCVEIYRNNAAHTFPGVRCVWKFTGKKRAWTLHKSHFVWKFTGKMPPAQVPTSIKHGPSVPYRKNPFNVATLVGE